MIEQDIDSLAPGRVFDRRAFVRTSVGSGFAAAVLPVVAQTTIKTDTNGLTAGEVTIPVGDFKMPAYRAAPAGKANAPVVLVVSEIFGVHEHIADVARRFAKAGYFAVAPELFVRQGDAGSYGEISKLMAPLYVKASTIAPDSPIKAEADAIAARTSDPKTRAFLALQLVETKTRYFFIGMGEGGYVPAQADDTWARRFGDCKAKTALLLALLKNLGVEAEPVLVNLGGGDGINEFPPSLAAFNHVIVRVKIDGQSYWLDGTRTGDTNPQSMHAPNHKWGLPVRAEGATLEQIVEPQITVPTASTMIRLDASKGLEALAPARISITYSGVLATQARALLARTPRADFERGFRQQFTNPASGRTDVRWSTRRPTSRTTGRRSTARCIASPSPRAVWSPTPPPTSRASRPRARAVAKRCAASNATSPAASGVCCSHTPTSAHPLPHRRPPSPSTATSPTAACP